MEPKTAGRPPDADSERTRAGLIEAAIHRFARQGLASTTLRQVAETAGVSSGTLYHYFSSKTALYHEAYLAATDDQLSDFKATCAELQTIRECTAALLDCAYRRSVTKPDVGVFILRAWVERNAEQQEPMPVTQEILDFYDSIAQIGIRSGEVTEQTAPQAVDSIRCMLWGVSAISVTGRSPYDGVEGMKLFVAGEVHPR
ncbi:MAG: TetR/AcrR family transcriptional regulator [Cumulibacter sp.]